MTMRASNQLATRWIEMYGIARMSGVSIRDSVLASDTDLSWRAFDAQAIAEAARSVQLQVAIFSELQKFAALSALPGQGVQASEALSIASGAAGALPVVGNILSIVYGGLSAAANAVEETGKVSCNKDCSWPTSYHRRRFINVSWPPAVWGVNPHVQGSVWLREILHDGLVNDGLGAPGTLDMFGRLCGATALVSRDARQYPHALHGNINEWSRHVMSERGCDIPKGNPSSPASDPGNNWYYRAWKARGLINWLSNAVSCENLMCLISIHRGANEALRLSRRNLTTPEQVLGFEVVEGIIQRTGSRWYSSLFWTQKDIWDLANILGAEKTYAILRPIDSAAADRFKRLMTGAYTPKGGELRFPWSYAIGKLSLSKCKKALIEMIKAAPEFSSASGSAGAQRIGVATIPANILSIARAVRGVSAAAAQDEAAREPTAAERRRAERIRPVEPGWGLKQWGMLAGGVVVLGGLAWILRGKRMQNPRDRHLVWHLGEIWGVVIRRGPREWLARPYDEGGSPATQGELTFRTLRNAEDYIFYGDEALDELTVVRRRED